MRYFKAYMVTLKYIAGKLYVFQAGHFPITSNKRNYLKLYENYINRTQ